MDGNVLRTACLLPALMLALLDCLVGCTPTPFVAGVPMVPPTGCVEARERGHEC